MGEENLRLEILKKDDQEILIEFKIEGKVTQNVRDAFKRASLKYLQGLSNVEKFSRKVGCYVKY